MATEREMTIDRTGISSVNEFYTEHYLATYFEQSVRETVQAWNKDVKDSEDKAPYQKLRDVARLYDRAFRHGQSIASDEDARELITAYLAALGYPEPRADQIQLPTGNFVPLFAEYLDEKDRPRVWVIACRPKDDEDLLLAVPQGLSDEEDETSCEIACEDALDALLLDVDNPARFVILVSAKELILVDRNKWSEKRYLSFDMEEIFRRRETSTYQATATLLAYTSLCPAEGAILIDDLDRQAREHASGVSDSLRYALRECVELLGNEVIHDWTKNKGRDLDSEPIDAGELTIECLRYMYRMLFLLFMEARPELGFAPTKSEAYLKSYSLESIRALAEGHREGIDVMADDTDYIDRTLRIACDIVYDGYPASDAESRRLRGIESTNDVFLVPPLKAHIFDKQRTPLIDDARLRDSVMLQIIDKMSYTHPSKGRSERVSYGTLGINQLGGVYEALLSYRGFIASEQLYEVKRAKDKFDELDVGYFVTEAELDTYTEDERVRYENGPRRGELRTYEKGRFIYRLAGREREKSASYYTPESLTQCLVKYALKELLEDKSADEILQLTICEPAMGSAAFLNEAVSQLAEAYLERKQKELGQTIPSERRQLELQRVKMFIADRNVYGIDLNPIAVELGEVSLWLNTISQDGYVPWFGNQLHCGNSLIGARRQGYTEKDLTSKAKGIRWYDHEPERASFKTGCSKSHRVYHFLVGDPGMASYKDRTVKGLEPEAIRKIAAWSKAFTLPYNVSEIRSLRDLSYEVDRLWSQQVEQQRTLRQHTLDHLDCFGFEDSASSGHTSIREKDRLLSLFYRSDHAKNAGPYARLKFAMDYWCALWFWPIDQWELLPTRNEFLLHMSFILVGTTDKVRGVRSTANPQMRLDLGVEFQTAEQLEIQELEDEFGMDRIVDLDDLCNKFPTLALARKIARRQHFFHWELEFADVFEARGGFDLLLGNPPWVKLEFKSVDVLSDISPHIAVKKLTKVEASRQISNMLENASAKEAYLDEYESVTGAQCFYLALQNYPILKGTSTNLYKCFIPQALSFVNSDAVFAFVHPTGVFDETNAREFRKVLYKKLRKYYRFENELKLFKDVGHAKKFSIAIYGASDTRTFECINSLFNPSTIDECYLHTNIGSIPGLKDDNGWCTTGHRQRIITVSEDDLRMFAKAFGDESDWRGTALPVVHAVPIMNILRAFGETKSTLIGSKGSSMGTTLWPETGAQENGIIAKREHFPADYYDCIITGPNIGLSNPIYQGAKEQCNTHHAYDLVNIETIPDTYIQRVKYSPCCSKDVYYSSAPNAWGNTGYLDLYRILARRRLNQSGSRTLMCALYPPNTGHVHTVLGIACSSNRTLLALLGEMSSVIFDGFIKITGKSDIYFDTVETFPLPDELYADPIIHRVLLLNCLTRHFASVWSDNWSESFLSDSFSRTDDRLDNALFNKSMRSWTSCTPCRIEYQRRQLLLELDVLTAMSLGLSCSDLENLYRLQFPVLKQYEENTWYDRNGRVVYTTNKGFAGVGFSRQEFERIQGAVSGTFQKTVIDVTHPDGQIIQSIDYAAPFDKCDRLDDYRTAWLFFEKRIGTRGGSQ